jgi:hypothetical protein
VKLLAPSAVAQAALWVALQHLHALPPEILAALQQQQQQQKQQQQLTVLISLLQSVATALQFTPVTGTTATAVDTDPAAATAAAMLNEAVAAQLLPLFHRAYLLQQLLQQQAPAATLADSYARVTTAPQHPKPTPAAAGSSSSKGQWTPSQQLHAVLRELGVSSSLLQLLQAALAAPAVQKASGVQDVGVTTTTSASPPPPAAAVAPGDQWGLPAWLSQDMLAYCYETVAKHTAAAAAATAAATAEQAASSSTKQQQQQQQQQHVLVPRRPCFMALPASYQDLYLSVSEVKCGACGKVPDHPALCLVTGR